MNHNYSRRACFLLVLMHYCMGHATVASAQPPAAWTNLGLAGASRVMAIDGTTTPPTLYAGMMADMYRPNWGVYKSIDSGASWNAVNTGLPDGSQQLFGVFALAIDPATATLYAGLSGTYDGGPGDGGGMYQSIDGGGTWSAVGGLSADLGVLAIAIDPTTTPSTMYAGTCRPDPVAPCRDGGMFMSIDGGATWTGPSLTSGIFALAIDPTTTNPSTVYAGAYAGGVFQSLDGGGTWNAISNGLPTDMVFSALAIDWTTMPSTLYAGKGTSYGTAGGVFKSIDGGVSWSDITSGLPTDYSIHALAIGAGMTSMTTLYVGSFGGGVFTSPDGGSSWSAFNTGLSDRDLYLHGFAFDPQTPTTLYAATCNNGVFVTSFASPQSYWSTGLTRRPQ